MNYFLIYTDGQMTRKELKECAEGSWIPLYTYQETDKDGEDIKVVPFFTDKEIAKRFLERNVPDAIPSAVQLTNESIIKLEEEGFNLVCLSFPRKVPCKPKVHIIESAVELATC